MQMNGKTIVRRCLGILCAAALLLPYAGCGRDRVPESRNSSGGITSMVDRLTSDISAGDIDDSSHAGESTGSSRSAGHSTKAGGGTTKTASADQGKNEATVATVRAVDGIPRLFLNGKQTAPVFFMIPFVDLNEEVKQELTYSAKYGVNIIFVSYDIQYYDLPQIYANRLKGVINALRAYDPDIRIVLRLDIGGDLSNLGLGDSEALYQNGQKTKRVSMASDAWYTAAADALRSIVGCVRQDAFLNEYVIGYEYLGGDTGEWFEPGYWDAKMDTSDCNRKKFQQYLGEKYGTDEALQKAWQTKLTLKSVRLPNYNSLPGIGNSSAQSANVAEGQSLLTSAKNQIYVDYFDYLNDLRAQRLNGFAKVIKDASGGQKLAITYYGYACETPTASSAHLGLSKLLASPYIDMLSGPVSYTDRNDGGVGAYMSMVDSITASGKMWVDEGDYYSPVHTKECEQAYPATTQLLDQVVRRELGKCMVFNTGVWWLDLHGHGWFSYESFWKTSRAATDLLARYSKVQKKTVPDICVVMDESAMSLLGNAQSMGANLMQITRTNLYRSGYRFGMYLMDDLIAGKIDDAKVYIILTPWRMSREKAQAVRSKVQRSGKTALWLYGNGATDEADFSSMTGMAIRSAVSDAGYVPRFDLADGLGTGMTGGGPSLNPIYYVEAADAKVLGTYVGGAADGKVGFASVSRNGWNSVFYGGLNVSSDMIRYLAELGGAHRYSDSGDVLYADSQFVTLHVTEGGSKVIRFPRACDIYNVETGKWSHGSAVTVQASKGQTVMLFYGDKSKLSSVAG